ncbi:Heat shock protein DnaJ-like [hydrothermal vent metagenome]|uniref:Heat shock protein DnaJ-like n=1 Tax=hydrothermal vent metagenome TaxID=652676 RepID=A0A1W1EI70_9ZZZZ
MKIKYDEFEKAVEIFGLIGVENKDDIRKKYLKLSKKFQDINKAYEILKAYVDSFKFRFTKEEFQEQHPFSITENGQWSLW